MVTEIRWPQTVEAFDIWVSLPENADHHYEFISNRVIEKMASTHDHGRVTTKLCSYITMHIETHDLVGYTTGETSGFMLGDTRCIPDCAFIPEDQSTSEAYRAVAPALVIEVISNPDNKLEMADLLDKREIYLAAGATVWELYHHKRYVDIYAPDGSYSPERDKLAFSGLPGLVIPLDRIFRPEAQED